VFFTVLLAVKLALVIIDVCIVIVIIIIITNINVFTLKCCASCIRGLLQNVR